MACSCKNKKVAAAPAQEEDKEVITTVQLGVEKSISADEEAAKAEKMRIDNEFRMKAEQEKKQNS